MRLRDLNDEELDNELARTGLRGMCARREWMRRRSPEEVRALAQRTSREWRCVMARQRLKQRTNP